ncbi:hypothetical protein KSS87_016890 [Heliosperma pusillum]|nr:hypothetical protein KSS87_016890 [Heliosperma pusillum]
MVRGTELRSAPNLLRRSELQRCPFFKVASDTGMAGMENIVLKLHYRANFVELLIEDTDRILLIDVYNDMFDEVEADKIEWPENPSLAYSYKMESVLLRNDNDLLEMFNRLGGKKIIDLWVGSEVDPCQVLVLARQLRGNGANVENSEVVGATIEKEKPGTIREKLPCRRSVLKPQPEPAGVYEASESFIDPIVEVNDKAPTVCLLTPRRSSRLNKTQVTEPDIVMLNDVEASSILLEKTQVNESRKVDSIQLTPRRSSRLNKTQVTESRETEPDIVMLNDVEDSSILLEKTQVNESRKVDSILLSPNRSERHNTRHTNTITPTSPVVLSTNATTRRTSSRFKTPQTVQTSQSQQSKFKMARTSALRKGLYIPKDRCTALVVNEESTGRVRSSRSGGVGLESNCDHEASESDGTYVPSEVEEDDEGHGLSDLVAEDHTVIATLQYVDDQYNPYEEQGWVDECGGYNAKLFKNGFNLVVVKAECNRYTADCATASCGWRIHASVLPDGKTWAIKSIRSPDHGCDGVRNKNPMANCKWVASKLMEDVRANHDISAKSVNDLLMKRYGLKMPNSSVYKMKEIALREINGGHDESYRLLCQYCEMVKLTNHGSVALASGSINPDGVLQFKSCFISFHAQFTGLIRGCRILIGVDGAHLKGNYGGVLLFAVALDGNNEIFPIAVAIVDSENKESWCYFFLQLKQLVNDCGREGWTIISDRQGVEPALEAVWPEAYRRLCAIHLCKNFKQEHPGILMHGLFWRVVNATNEYTFKKALEMVVQHGGLGAARWFLDLGDKEAWAKHKFDPRLCCEDNTSNFVESFNATLGVHRRMSMIRHASRQEAADSWPNEGICPNILNRLKDLTKDSRHCYSYSSGNGEFEVRDGGSFQHVNLNLRTCECGAWQISGIPCKHAIRAILDAGREPADFVSEWFSVKRYKEAYGLNIHPISDSAQWPTFNVPSLEPPVLRRAIGRPSRNRRREPGEQRKGKRSIVIRCKKCGCMGHNSKTCKGGLTAKEKGQLRGNVTNKRTKTSQPSSSRINFTSLNHLEALVMGTQTSTSVHPPPTNQSKPSTSTQRPQQKGRKRKQPVAN